MGLCCESKTKKPPFIRALKDGVDEDTDYEQQISFYKKLSFSLRHKVSAAEYVCNSSVICKGTQADASTLQRTTEYKNGMVAIHPRYNKLITALRTAVENGEGVLDKEATSHDDLLDAFRESLMF